MLESNPFDETAFRERCPSCGKLTEQVFGTPSEEALKTHEGVEYPVTEKYDRIDSAAFSSLDDLFELCHKGNVNCQEYYLDGILGVIPCIGGDIFLHLGDYTNYEQPYNPEHKDWKRQPMIVLKTPNNLITNTTAGDLIVQRPWISCVERKANRTDYKIRLRKVLWKYDNVLWDPFPYSNPDAPLDSTIVRSKHSLLANAEQIEVFYDPENRLKPAMRIYSEQVAADEDARGIVWMDEAVKRSGLRSVRLIDANAAILDDMEKNPYISKPAP